MAEARGDWRIGCSHSSGCSAPGCNRATCWLTDAVNATWHKCCNSRALEGDFVAYPALARNTHAPVLAILAAAALVVGCALLQVGVPRIAASRLGTQGRLKSPVEVI